MTGFLEKIVNFNRDRKVAQHLRDNVSQNEQLVDLFFNLKGDVVYGKEPVMRNFPMGDMEFTVNVYDARTLISVRNQGIQIGTLVHRSKEGRFEFSAALMMEPELEDCRRTVEAISSFAILDAVTRDPASKMMEIPID
jgi:hypothetical protein